MANLNTGKGGAGIGSWLEHPTDNCSDANCEHRHNSECHQTAAQQRHPISQSSVRLDGRLMRLFYYDRHDIIGHAFNGQFADIRSGDDCIPHSRKRLAPTRQHQLPVVCVVVYLDVICHDTRPLAASAGERMNKVCESLIGLPERVRRRRGESGDYLARARQINVTPT